MMKVKEFEKDDIDRVIAFERELREQEPDTYYWEPDATYRSFWRRALRMNGAVMRCHLSPLRMIK